MIKLIAGIAAHAGTSASIIGLYFSIVPLASDRPWWHWAVVALVIFVTALISAKEASDYFHYAPKCFRKDEKIRAYMRRWVSSGGRAVIFSRDMTWVDEGVFDLLATKARNNELTVCAESPIKLTEDLEKLGAQIIYYKELGHIPRSRFTIVDFQKEGARVAIGAKQGPVQKIQEFESGSHPAFALAEDMVKLLLGMQANRNR